MLKLMCPALNVDYVTFRFQNVYGVGQSLKNPYTGILSIFSTLMLKNKDINIFEDGNESRDFVNVADIADAVIKAIENENCKNQTINLGSGERKSVIEVAESLKRNYNSNSDLKISGDFRIGDIAHNFADITLAEELLDYKPKVKFEKGMTDFCNWVKDCNIEDIDYEKSLEEMKSNNMLINKE